MARVVRFTAPGHAEAVEIEDPPVGPDEVRIENVCSDISAGTELTAYRGSNQYLTNEWDSARRLFVPGDSTRGHHRISIVGSQTSGVAPALQHRWDELPMSGVVLDLERSGRLRLRELVTHTFPADDAPAAFQMLDQATEPALQVVLDYQVSA